MNSFLFRPYDLRRAFEIDDKIVGTWLITYGNYSNLFCNKQKIQICVSNPKVDFKFNLK